jgi:hypothetical protein
VARPSKFNDEAAGAILNVLSGCGSRRDACEMAGVSTRTLDRWLAKGRKGVEPFVGFVAQVEVHERRNRRIRLAHSCLRLMARNRESWLRFKEARQRWWLERLGPEEYWARRIRWLLERGAVAKAQRLIDRLRAEGYVVTITA